VSGYSDSSGLSACIVWMAAGVQPGSGKRCFLLSRS
jgi:hypothetical protein